ncbi:MAG: acyltransferase family protein [Methylococcales bacterium]|nr:acyltransferase family protein [Methylococcales bacterium]
MKENNIFWIDVIRAVATFSVILLHSAFPILYAMNDVSPSVWWAGNIYDSMVRVCVPLFVMLSGYLLLDKNESLAIFFSKRITKVVIPLIIWSLFYLVWTSYIEQRENLTFHHFYSLLIMPSYFHLWFLYTLIGLYLYIPILRIFVQKANTSLLIYFVVLWLFAASLIPLFEKITAINSMIDLKMISGAIGYLVIGHLFKRLHVTRQLFFLSIITYFSMITLTMAGTYFFTLNNNGEFYAGFYDFLSPNVIVMSIASFIFLRYNAEHTQPYLPHWLKKLTQSISAASLGIYLIHAGILLSLKKGYLGFTLTASSFHAAYAIPATATMTFSLSFLIIYVMQKIPLIQKCVP